MRKTVVVVGSGIAGILSAILLEKKFEKIYLLDKEDHIGGLLSSYKIDERIEFDQGAHFLRDTGLPDLDDILYGHMSPEKWLTIGNLRGGNYFLAQLNEQSPFLDTRLLPEELYQKGMMQLLSAEEKPAVFENLEDFLKHTFGDTFTNTIFHSLAKKFLGSDLRELAPGSIGLIALLTRRIIGFTPAITRELKKSSLFDKKLAFHSNAEGSSRLKNYYPKKGGIGLWVEEMEEKLACLGVEILRNSLVKKISHSNNQVQSVVLNDGFVLDCDQLIWTAPVYQYIQCCQITPPFQAEPPTRLITSLYHFIYDQPFLTDLFYLICIDPEMPAFRITLYSNIQGVWEGEGYRLTVEVLSQDAPNLENTSKQVQEDLKTMGIVAQDAKIIFQHSDILYQTFPVPTPRFIQDAQRQLTFAQEHFKNVLFLGKNIGSTWFMQEVLTETYHAVKRL